MTKSVLKTVFGVSAAGVSSKPVKCGIWCDISGTLVKLASAGDRYCLNYNLARFLLWAKAQKIPVHLFSSDVAGAETMLRSADFDPKIIDPAGIQSKMDVYSFAITGQIDLELVIDDTPPRRGCYRQHWNPDDRIIRMFFALEIYKDPDSLALQDWQNLVTLAP